LRSGQDPGFTAETHVLASLKPEQQTIALTSSPEVINELSIVWGVETVITDRSNSIEQLLKFGEQALLQLDLSETVVIVAGRLSGLGLSSSVRCIRLRGDIREMV
jgi:pyruvate kinase